MTVWYALSCKISIETKKQKHRPAGRNSTTIWQQQKQAKEKTELKKETTT
jgi:hypothetical protein